MNTRIKINSNTDLHYHKTIVAISKSGKNRRKYDRVMKRLNKKTPEEIEKRSKKVIAV